MTSYNGKCHCGQVEWTVKFDSPSHVLCHCNTCKALSGSEFTLNALMPKSDLSITKGSVKSYDHTGDSGKPVHCYYCPNCTTHVYHHQTVMGDTIVARTVLLDGGRDFPLQAEIYGKDKLAWQKEAAQTFEVLPPHL